MRPNPDNSDSSPTKFPKLHKGNWSSWKINMKNFLRSKSLWKYMLGIAERDLIADKAAEVKLSIEETTLTVSEIQDIRD